MEGIDAKALAPGSASGLGPYGSYARDTNDLDSDIDVWIGAESLPSESELARLNRDLSLQAEAEVNLLVLTPEKLESLKRDDPTFYRSLAMSSLTLKGEDLLEDR